MKLVLGTLNDELLTNIANQAASFCTQVDVAVAYADRHPFFDGCKEQGLRMTFYGLLDDEGAVSPALLAELLAWGPSHADCRLVKGNFHAKVIWWRGYGAYVGSANLTHKAWFHNVEAGVFFDETELLANGIGDELDAMFDHLAEHHVPVTHEVVQKLEKLAQERRAGRAQEERIQARFVEFFGNLPDNPALMVRPPKGHRENKALKNFAAEWMRTLQVLRGLAVEFARLELRPAWVRADAHPAIHFDQFLHAYYYDFVRGSAIDADDELSGLDKVEAFFKQNRANPAAALREGARWWAALPSAPYDEDVFIQETAPAMRRGLSRDPLANMTTLEAFRDAVRPIKALRMHARQVRNVEFGLPPDHHEPMADRVNRLCEWLWGQRTPTGKTVRDVLEFVIWGTNPSDMEQRLWLGVWGDDWRLEHFGQSMLGEAIGWARPDDYPPRNNRTNKALRALGHDVKLFR